ncbi:MAG TPA: integrase family protein [Geothrix sp.]|nr:integrase family protein [Geothrix sp.]
MQPTASDLKALDAVAGKIVRIPVDGQPSLYVQITGKPGSPILSWVFRYRVGKKQVNHTLGRWPGLSWPEVRSQMIDLRKQAKAGVRLSPPRQTLRGQIEVVATAAAKVENLITAREKLNELIETKLRREAIATMLGEAPAPPADPTPKVREVAEKWYAGHVLVKNKPKTQAWQRWALDKYVLPQLGDLKITGLTRPKVFAFLDGLGETPVTANRVKALISKMWNWSEARDETPGSPMASMPNPTKGWERHTETPRERRLSVTEIVALGKAYHKNPSALNSAAIFVLLTGCREGAVFALAPGTKLHDGLLRFAPGLPGLKGCRRVYVPPVAAEVLKRVKAPVLKRSLWRSWSKLRLDAGLGPKEVEDGVTPTVEDLGVSLQDLRRTFSSVGVDQGHDSEVIDVLQSHSVGKIRGTYQVRSDPALAKVAEEVSEYIAGLLGIHVPRPIPAAAKAPSAIPAEGPSTSSKAARNPTAEPPVGVKAARMAKKEAKAAKQTGKAKLFQRRQK